LSRGNPFDVAFLAVTGPIRSVVDVGGGSGAWLEAFRNRGVEKNFG
jgi:hypothetical protein